MTLTLKEIFDVSRELWGTESQLLMLAEESCELTKASLKLVRLLKHKNVSDIDLAKRKEKLAEEMADTLFMVEEIVYYFNLKIAVNAMRGIKEEKLKRKIQHWAQTHKTVQKREGDLPGA